ncbi:hypothetical protein ABPG72_005050 [Tetrahymena utriculariae]
MASNIQDQQQLQLQHSLNNNQKQIKTQGSATKRQSIFKEDAISDEGMKNISKVIQELQLKLKPTFDNVSKIKLPRITGRYQEAWDELNRAKEELISMIEQYFIEMDSNLKEAFSKFPCDELRVQTQQRIQSILKEFDYYSQKMLANNLQEQDAINFKSRKYEQQMIEIEQDVQFLDNAFKMGVQLKQSNFPYFKVDRKQLEQILMSLNDYIYTVCPPEDINEQLLEIPYIDLDQYYNISNIPFGQTSSQVKQIQKIAYFFDRTVSFLDLQSNQIKQLLLPIQYCQYQPSYLMLPNQNIFYCGGIDDTQENCDGLISSRSFEINTTKYIITQLAEMKVKRIGHSIVYATVNYQEQSEIHKLKSESNISIPLQKNNQQNKLSYIYAIGGKTNFDTKTKLCERYDVQRNVWESIAPLNQARSRAACCLFNEKYIYAFYGTSSENKSVQTVEKYDLELNKWEILEVVNQLPGFDVSFSAAIQINSSQIILIGGFRESMLNDKGFMLFNRKLICFNTQNSTLSLFKYNMPLDLLPFSSPVISNNDLYIIGTCMENISEEKPCLLQKNAFVVKLDEMSGPTITKVISTTEGQEIQILPFKQGN